MVGHPGVSCDAEGVPLLWGVWHGREVRRGELQRYSESSPEDLPCLCLSGSSVGVCGEGQYLNSAGWFSYDLVHFKNLGFYPKM